MKNKRLILIVCLMAVISMLTFCFMACDKPAGSGGDNPNNVHVEKEDTTSKNLTNLVANSSAEINECLENNGKTGYTAEVITSDTVDKIIYPLIDNRFKVAEDASETEKIVAKKQADSMKSNVLEVFNRTGLQALALKDDKGIYTLDTSFIYAPIRQLDVYIEYNLALLKPNYKDTYTNDLSEIKQELIDQCIITNQYCISPNLENFKLLDFVELIDAVDEKDGFKVIKNTKTLIKYIGTDEEIRLDFKLVLDDAFADCDNLKKIRFNNLEQVQFSDYAFRGVDKLELDVPFYINAEQLEQTNWAKNITGLVKIVGGMEYTFNADVYTAGFNGVLYNENNYYSEREALNNLTNMDKYPELKGSKIEVIDKFHLDVLHKYIEDKAKELKKDAALVSSLEETIDSLIKEDNMQLLAFVKDGKVIVTTDMISSRKISDYSISDYTPYYSNVHKVKYILDNFKVEGFNFEMNKADFYKSNRNINGIINIDQNSYLDFIDVQKVISYVEDMGNVIIVQNVGHYYNNEMQYPQQLLYKMSGDLIGYQISSDIGEIYDHAFKDAPRLEYLDINNSNIYFGKELFAGTQDVVIRSNGYYSVLGENWYVNGDKKVYEQQHGKVYDANGVIEQKVRPELSQMSNYPIMGNEDLFFNNEVFNADTADIYSNSFLNRIDPNSSHDDTYRAKSVISYCGRIACSVLANKGEQKSSLFTSVLGAEYVLEFLKTYYPNMINEEVPNYEIYKDILILDRGLDNMSSYIGIDRALVKQAIDNTFPTVEEGK